MIDMSFIDKFIKTQFERNRKHITKSGNQSEKVRVKQFNTTISADLIEGVKTFSAMLGVPMWVLVEHTLQSGFYHLLMACRDPKKEKIVRDHLIKHHLLSSEFVADNIDIIRLDETVYPMKLINYIRELMNTIGIYMDTMEWILSGGDVRLAQATIVKLRNRSLVLANFVNLWLKQLDHFDDTNAQESNQSLSQDHDGSQDQETDTKSDYQD
jgi:hypothetical protein